MKRSQIVFVAVVFAALLAGFLVERTQRSDPFAELNVRPPRSVVLDPLELPSGQLSIEGKVRSSIEGAQADVLLYLHPNSPGEEARPLAWTITDVDGNFRLDGLAAGEYRAILMQVGHEHANLALTVPAQAPVEWSLGEPLEPVPELPELSRSPLPGIVRSDGSISLADYEVVLRPAPGTDPLSGALVRRSAVDGEGRFAFEGLVHGDYSADLLPPWARGGSWPSLRSLSFNHPSTPAGSAELELTFHPALIVGRLRDASDRAVEGALVQLWSVADEHRLWPSVETDRDGAFRLEGLPAGSFVVRVRAGAAAIERIVDLAEGEEVELALPAIHPQGDPSGG